MPLRLSQNQYDKLINNKEGKENKKSSISTKPSKYRNKKITVDGIKYDSIHEYDRHCYLKILEKSGEIQNLRFHDKTDTIVLQEYPKITYEPDFCYDKDGVHIIEDVKGMQTKEFKLKKKMIISMLIKKELDGKFILTKCINKNNFTIIEEYDSEKK